MVDFLKIGTRVPKKGFLEVYPKFVVKSTSADLMIRGGDFYAIWLEDQKKWSTDEQDVIDLIDRELTKFYEELRPQKEETIRVMYMWDAETGMIDRWHKFCQKQMRDNYHQLNQTIIFENSETKKRDYASKRLPYALTIGDTPAYDRLMGVLYSPEERQKIEWSIGSVVNGDSRKIQKFVVLYGPPGSGKGTVLEIIDQLFTGYTTTFSAKNLGMAGAQFALEPFKDGPLVGIQTDGDLSRIEDNSRLNALISHEKMIVNEKHKTQYTAKFSTFLFLGTNKPVKITDAKSGLLRRLIDVTPSGDKIPKREYDKLMDQVKFELGGIAAHCKQVYEENPRLYDGYVPEKMVSVTNTFYNFIVDHYFEFSNEDGVTLKQSWEMYKTWCDEAKMQYPLNKMQFKDELMNYFYMFEDRGTINGQQMYNLYSGFKKDMFKSKEVKDVSERVLYDAAESWLKFDSTKSLFDKQFAHCKAQLAGANDKPTTKWERVTTTLADIDTSKVHYVQLPIEIITVDFDIPDEDGNKSLERNMKAAEKWPPTYAELSKSGCGIHLNYIYEGDASDLDNVFADHIEIKVMKGNASLRRRLSLCNDLPIATISSGLKRKEKKMTNEGAIKSERKLRELIERNLRKEIHPGTKPSIDFIHKILEDAYNDGLKYDVTDMRQAILTFAMGSTHQADYCVKLVSKMKFRSEEFSETTAKKDEIAIFDIEVYMNYFLVCWKIAEDVDWDYVRSLETDTDKWLYFLDLVKNHKKKIIRMKNPTPDMIEKLLDYKLVGFNCRRYDNHILYGRLMGYSNEGCYNQSQKIINGSKNPFFGEAYNLSWTDVYDFCSKKQSLKKWEIELGFHHQEMGIPWDQPVPEELFDKVAEYCDNDVLATELVLLCRHDDFVARQVLADIAGMTVNDTSNSLTTRIIFGTNRRPQSQFNYRFMGDMSTAHNELSNERIQKYGLAGSVDTEYTIFDSKGRPLFPGYTFDAGKSIYRGEEVGEGGYVYAEPGIWTNVALLDIASMHPSSIVAEDLFGEYTANFKALLDVRLAIKHGDFAKAKKLLPGIAKYLDDPGMADTLSQALKIPINSVYGLTAATFDNAFRDLRNVDNIVAKRGALFMVNLKHEVQKRGFTVAHIKTDSIKIPNATPEIIQFVYDYGRMYGYTFEHECTYDRMCLVNDAVYIAKYASVEKCYDLYGKKYIDSEKDICKKNKKKAGKWEATGTQFQVPYVYKTLFSHEELEFNDFCETKSVSKGELYLDMNEDLPQLSREEEIELDKIDKAWHSKAGSKPLEDLANKLGYTFEQIGARYNKLCEKEAKTHNYVFVGRVGQFCPMEEGADGGVLYRYQDGKYYAVTGTKGYRWLESEMVKTLGKEDLIDKSYYIRLVDEAKKAIGEYGDFEMFANADEFLEFMSIPDNKPDGDYELPWDESDDGVDPAEKQHPKDG